jgi:hypothetical protein
MATPSSSPRRLTLPIAIAALALAVASGPAAAGGSGRPPYLTATGDFAVVALIDDPTLAGGICFFCRDPLA